MRKNKKVKEIKLPTWEECRRHLEHGQSALEVFIYEYQPSFRKKSEDFRMRLLSALYEVRNQSEV